MIDELSVVFNKLGMSVVYFGKRNANGPDLWVKRYGGRPLSVEIKKVAKKKNGTWQVPPVEINRRHDDLIAIRCPKGYFLIEPMADHLKACGKSGYRQLTTLLKE